MNAVHAFIFNGNDWKKSELDDWEWDIVEIDGSEKVLGHLPIDGSIYKIVETFDGKLAAITKS